MRNGLLFLTFVTATTTGFASSYEVHIPAVMQRMVRHDGLPKPCRTNRYIRACTVFAGELLTCACTRDGSDWRISARAQYIPIIFLTSLDSEYRKHEELHIQDIDGALKKHLEELVNRRFSVESECEASAASAADNFKTWMDRFKRDSTALRD